VLTEPWVQAAAPQVPTLLSVFSHYTGQRQPKPVSIGGGTNARLFPNAVSFGPAMPGAVYSGHSEHEFITVKQLMLNLEMYTAAMVELAK
jgi:dipeptidase D